MSCDELRPDYLLYALGVLEEPERSELKSHLERGCENCTAGIRGARAMAFAIGSTPQGPEPPALLRDRVLSIAGAPSDTIEITRERFRWPRVWLPVSATALAAIGIIVYQSESFRRQISQMRTAVEQSNSEAASMRETLELLQNPDTREVTFGEGQPAPPRGRVFFDRSGVLLLASNLPSPPPGRTYEMWIIRDGQPAPAGLFRSDPQGNASHFYRPATPPAANDVIAVTNEPAAGVASPTTAPIIAARL